MRDTAEGWEHRNRVLEARAAAVAARVAVAAEEAAAAERIAPLHWQEIEATARWREALEAARAWAASPDA